MLWVGEWVVVGVVGAYSGHGLLQNQEMGDISVAPVNEDVVYGMKSSSYGDS